MIVVVAALVFSGLSAPSPKISRIDPDPISGGYDPIITLPAPGPGQIPQPKPTREAPGAPSFLKVVAMGSAGEFPGNVYRVHYRLSVFTWSDSESNWVPTPSTQVTKTSNLTNPIVVSWNEASQGSEVQHGVKGSLGFHNMSGKKVRLEFYWVPGGDAFTPPENEASSVEFTVP